MGEFYGLDFSAEELVPKLTEAVALQKALDYVGAQKYMWQEPGMDKMPDGQKPTGELVIVEDIFGNKGMRLAYKFNVYASQPVSRSYMYVDAADGTIVFINRNLGQQYNCLYSYIYWLLKIFSSRRKCGPTYHIG